MQIFPASAATIVVADKIWQVLAEGYDANATDLEVQSTWVKSEPCPPRNGPTQNLSRHVNDAPSMAELLFTLEPTSRSRIWH